MKTKSYLLATLLLLSGLLTGWPAISLAVTGTAIPEFNYPLVHIPRVDVEGYGALTVELRLQDATKLVFSIDSEQAANSSIAPGASYDLKTGVMVVPLLKAGSAYYNARLQSTTGNLFQVVELKPATLAGQSSYQQQCANCHGADGLGGPLKISMKNCRWCTDVNVLSTYIAGNMPFGAAAKCSGSCATDVANFILTVFNTSTAPPVEKTLSALQSLAPVDTLRKASLQLVSRLPTAQEQLLVTQNGEAGLRTALNGMMTEAPFFNRLSEIFNDFLLTNRYLTSNGTEAAISLMGDFPKARWYASDVHDAVFTFNQTTANDSVAAEPLELINYVVKNNLPATEMLTANYFMVNGYSAKSYGITDVVFKDEWDPKEFKPAKLAGIPHAGILSSLMFLNRYPTSATNRNRGRSRVVYDLFLDVDILALDGVRPNGTAVDITRVAPTMENPDCVKCHSLLDPVASLFQDWNLRGRFALARTWYKDMFQAGFAGTTLPTANKDNKLLWLSQQLAKDPRFDAAMLRIIHKGLTGQEPLRTPSSSATTAEVEAYQAEHSELEKIKAAYVADNRNLKTLIRELIINKYYRASGLSDTALSAVHADTGAAVLLAPEMLHRKIFALLGFEWRGPLDQYSTNKDVASSARLLNSRQYYQQLYGGIDSFNVTEHLTESNGLMIKVQERMANELACYAVPNDFLVAKASRRLFPFVDTTTTLLTGQNQSDVKANIQYLHQYLLGETLALTDAELTQTYNVFASALKDGQSKMVSKAESAALPSRCVRTKDLQTGAALATTLTSDPNYTIRAWMAVVAYLLSDYKFIYE